MSKKLNSKELFHYYSAPVNLMFPPNRKTVLDMPLSGYVKFVDNVDKALSGKHQF